MAQDFDNATFTGNQASAGLITPPLLGLPGTFTGTNVLNNLGVTSTSIDGTVNQPGDSVNLTLQAAGLPIQTSGTYVGNLNNSQPPVYIFSAILNGAPVGVAVSSADLPALNVASPINAGAAPADPSIPCFVSGTLILTERGQVAVEELGEGDQIVTSSGALRPIRWIGNRTIDLRRHSAPETVQPVRVAAGAFGECRPSRDLLVSPGHSIAVDVLGEVLIIASALINDTTITQLDLDEVTYWHVELESHDILLAEGLPAESYLDMGNRPALGHGNVIDLHASPDVDVSVAAARSHADFCRPFHCAGPVVDFVRQRLAERAKEMGWSLDDNQWSGVHLLVDGERVEPAIRGNAARFAFSAQASDVVLISGTRIPSQVGFGADGRSLGLYLAGLSLDDGWCAPRSVSIDDALLCVGFHAVEGKEDGVLRRWTAGEASLPADLWAGCEGQITLRLDLGETKLPHWIAPQAEKAELLSFRRREKAA